MKKFFSFILSILSAGILACGEKTHVFSVPAMGTVFTIRMDCSDSLAVKVYPMLADEISRLEELFSPFKTESDIFRINSSAGKSVTVSDETVSMLKRAVSVSDISGGAFDVSYVPLGRLWNYRSGNFRIPSEKETAAALDLVDYRKIIIDGNTVRLGRNGMAVSLGGIAKGYCADRCIAFMKESGIPAGIADAGGNMKFLGKKDGGWKTGIRHPREDGVFCALDLEDGEAVSTSGDYERFVMHDGRRYHHIISPATGYPAEDFMSVTVVCDSGERADAFSTALFAAGREGALSMLKKVTDLSAVMVTADFTVMISASLKGRVHIPEKYRVLWI